MDTFRQDGFAVFPSVLSVPAVNLLNDRLEDVLRGNYDRGVKPDKVPRLIKGRKPGDESSSGEKKASIGPIGFSGNLQNVKVLQIMYEIWLNPS